MKALLGRARLQDYGPILVLALLSTYFSFASDRFLSVSVLASLLESAAIPAVLVVGLTFVMLQGSIDLSLEGVVAATTMAVALLVSNTVTANDFGLFGLFIAVAMGLAFGLANGMLYIWFRIPSFIVTIGTWFVASGVATLLFPGRAPSITDHRLTDLALFKVGGLSLIVYCTIGLIFVATLVERHTRFGRISMAIGSDEQALRLAGIAVSPYKIGAFAICGMLAGVAGVFSAARLGVGNPIAGDGLLFPAVSAAVIGGTLLSGGRGGVIHSVIGVLILEVIRQGLIQTGSNPLVSKVIEGAATIIVVGVGTWAMRSKVRVVK